MTLFMYLTAALLYGECTVGIILNGFIVATNLKNWRQLKTFQPCDKILSCLATSRCLFLFYMMLLNVFFVFFRQLFQSPDFLSSVLVCTLLLSHTNFWLTTTLCVFYCVKITNYSHQIFIFLKTRISSLVHWFILASLLISVASSLPNGWFAYDGAQQNFTSGPAENMNVSKVISKKGAYNRLLMFLVGSLPPFLIFCVAIILLIHSLWVHIRHMRGGGTGFGSPNLEVHFGAVKSMSLFLVLHVVYFTCMSVRQSPTNGGSWVTVSSIVTCSPPLLHSLYIIFSTRKLKEELVKWFCCQ